MKNLFDIMIETQRELQTRLGDDCSFPDRKVKTAFIKEMSLFAVDEIFEMLHEMPYLKGWSKKYDSWDAEMLAQKERLAKEEFVDVLTFLMSVAMALGFTGEELERMYFEKNQINHQRQDNNY